MFLKVGKNFNGYLDQRTPETMLLESGINIYLYNYLLDVCHTYFVILTVIRNVEKWSTPQKWSV